MEIKDGSGGPCRISYDIKWVMGRKCNSGRIGSMRRYFYVRFITISFQLCGLVRCEALINMGRVESLNMRGYSYVRFITISFS